MKQGNAGTESVVLFRNSQWVDGRGTLMHLTRNLAVFEVYNPFSIVQLSEVLSELKIFRGERTIYSGKAVVSAIVPTGPMTIVSTTLVDAWIDLSLVDTVEEFRNETERFISDWERGHNLLPEYQLTVSTIANFLQEISRWIGKAEASFDQLGESEVAMLFEGVRDIAIPRMLGLFERFEACANEVPPENLAMHRAFAQRELHPLIMCSPFVFRTFTKPLGYAGDYEMVNMMLGEPAIGSNVYSRLVNAMNVYSGTAEAHRNRVTMLESWLNSEGKRVAQEGRIFRVLNIGCGPAKEIQRFVSGSDLGIQSEFQLMDFNEQTLDYTRSQIEELCKDHLHENNRFQFIHKSIHELLKEAVAKSQDLIEPYDFVYCAGLFDYLGDRVCERLTRLFSSWVRPGGLVVVTNVHVCNPFRNYMEHLLEWHLQYRDEQSFGAMGVDIGALNILTDKTGVNVFLEIRIPDRLG